ncbi:hypothetical protein [Shewanella glacialipiscicola]|uniref:hypothetical protein n=1 Tax=Shewanella glacialipiscicola TaxID=614069 RepID=UPI003D7A5545
MKTQKFIPLEDNVINSLGIMLSASFVLSFISFMARQVIYLGVLFLLFMALLMVFEQNVAIVLAVPLFACVGYLHVHGIVTMTHNIVVNETHGRREQSNCGIGKKHRPLTRMIFLYTLLISAIFTAIYFLDKSGFFPDPTQVTSSPFITLASLISASLFYYVALSLVLSGVNVMLDVTDRVFSMKMIVEAFDNLPSVARSSLRYGALICGTIGVIGDLSGFTVIAYVTNVALIICWASSVFTLMMGCEIGRFSPRSL